MTDIAITIKFRALVIYAMTDLVTDDRTDGAIVDRFIGSQIKKGRLKDRCGENNLI